jgi:hypothetical protein
MEFPKFCSTYRSFFPYARLGLVGIDSRVTLDSGSRVNISSLFTRQGLWGTTTSSRRCAMTDPN